MLAPLRARLSLENSRFILSTQSLTRKSLHPMYLREFFLSQSPFLSSLICHAKSFRTRCYKFRTCNSFRIRSYEKKGGVWSSNTRHPYFIILFAVGWLASVSTLAQQGLALPQAIKTLPPPLEHKNDPDPADPALAEPRSLLQQGRASQAEPLVRRYLTQHADSAEAHFLLGLALFRQIQGQAAADAGASSSPYAEKIVRGSAMAFRTEKAKASLAEYTEGSKYHAPSAADLKIVALDYVILEDYADADMWFTKMLSWTPSDSEGWYYLGRTKYNENRFAEAIQAFERSLNLDPQNVKAEDNLGLSYAGLGRNEEAFSAYQKAIEWQRNLLAKNSGPFIDMGSLLLDLNRSAEAIPYLQRALEISPQDSKSHELLGKAYSRLEQFPQAQVELEKAVELAPQNPNLPCMLGPVYRKQGLAEKAKLELDRCAALNGTHSSPETSRP
jgi:Flp pilus assembly protein TadD